MAFHNFYSNPQALSKLLLSIVQPQAVLKLLLSIDQPQAGLLYVVSLPNNLDEAPQIRSAHDYAETRFNDVATFDGFLQTIILVLRVKEKGLLHVGMPCASFVWISRSRHRRTAEAPFGDETQPNVLKANQILGRVALLLVLATVRKIWWLIEQPKSSMLPYCPNVHAVMAMAGNVVPTFYCQYYMGCWGHWCPKPSLSLGSASWLPKLQFCGSRPSHDQTCQ